jgi:hypothetical protein
MGKAFFIRRRRPFQRQRRHSTRPQVELLESRDVPSTFNLTPLVPVSGPSPFLGNPIEANDPASTINSEVEPYLAVDPENPNHLVGAWIQDFARGIVAGVSFNGGNTWQSVVIPGATAASGGTYPHSSDPWVSFAPNGDVYLSLIGHDFPDDSGDTIYVSKSSDGGLTWGAPTAIAPVDQKFAHDKESITADPTNSQIVYATWTRFTGPNKGPAMFSRSTDGGQTWEPARILFDPGSHSVAEGFQMVVLADGTLVNVFTQQLYKNDANGINHYDFKISLMRSTDHGQTWQFADAPLPVADILPLLDTATVPGARGLPNPDGGVGIDAHNWFFDLAMDPANGNLYAAWQDARFSNFQYTSIAFAMSTDGGLTWSTPIKINQTPETISVGNRQAFLPSIAVNQDGTVAVTYYDFRNNTPDPGLLTDVWMVHAHPADGLTNPASWSSENRITPASFNMENAPIRDGYFIGDYEGLVAEGKHFGAFFTMPTATDPTSVFFRDPLPPDSSPPAEPAPDHRTRSAIMPARTALGTAEVGNIFAIPPSGPAMPLRWHSDHQPFSDAPATGSSPIAIAGTDRIEASRGDGLWGGTGEVAIDQAWIEWQADEGAGPVRTD